MINKLSKRLINESTNCFRMLHLAYCWKTQENTAMWKLQFIANFMCLVKRVIKPKTV